MASFSVIQTRGKICLPSASLSADLPLPQAWGGRLFAVKLRVIREKVTGEICHGVDYRRQRRYPPWRLLRQSLFFELGFTNSLPEAQVNAALFISNKLPPKRSHVLVWFSVTPRVIS
eukprot:1395393-Amorphochlora_amoeboformis.AAC.2